jgi:hypothetical protein
MDLILNANKLVLILIEDLIIDSRIKDYLYLDICN